MRCAVNKVFGSREFGSREFDRREFGSRKFDSREFDSREFDSREFDSSELDSRRSSCTTFATLIGPVPFVMHMIGSVRFRGEALEPNEIGPPLPCACFN